MMLQVSTFRMHIFQIGKTTVQYLLIVFAALLTAYPAFSQSSDWKISQLGIANHGGYPGIDLVVDDSNGVHLVIGHMNDEGTASNVSYWYRQGVAEPWLKELVDEGSLLAPKIMLDDTGVPHIFYLKGRSQIIHAVPGTGGWNREAIAEPGNTYPVLGSDAQGMPSVMYSYQYRDSSGITWYEHAYSYLEGDSWQTEIAYRDSSMFSHVGGYAVDSLGRVHVALRHAGYTPGFEYIMRTGAGWSSQSEVLAEDAKFANLSVDTDSQDQPLIFANGSNSFTPSYLFHRTENGWISERAPYATSTISIAGRLFLFDSEEHRHLAFIAGHITRHVLLPEVGVWPGVSSLGYGDYTLSMGLTTRDAPVIAYWRNSSYGGPPSDFYLAEYIANFPPNADAGEDQLIQATFADGSAYVTLDGSGSSDEDGDYLSYEWTEEEVTVATSEIETILLPLGVHQLTLTVDDGQETGTDQVVITVDATIRGLAGLVNEFVRSGDISVVIGDHLLKHLASAAEDLEKGKLDSALHSLDQFLHLLDKEGDKGTITYEARATLTESARAVMGVLGS